MTWGCFTLFIKLFPKLISFVDFYAFSRFQMLAQITWFTNFFIQLFHTNNANEFYFIFWLNVEYCLKIKKIVNRAIWFFTFSKNNFFCRNIPLLAFSNKSPSLTFRSSSGHKFKLILYKKMRCVRLIGWN